MKIFVTVGTTPFERLIEAVDTTLSQHFKVVSQIANGNYLPQKNEFFRFNLEVEQYYQRADIVITHGGAGSIFRLLEMGKKIVIVPNLDRVDDHQLDICNYMAEHSHAAVCLELENLAAVVEEAFEREFVPYTPEEFTGIEPIRDFLGLNDKVL